MNDATYGPVGFRRFLHTHNPFYLISCFLIIYGLQSFAMGGGPHSGLLSTSIWMAGGIAAYILLMTLTCIAVVRLGKIWEDARSIFLVVIISLVALSTSFDQLCIEQFERSFAFAIAGFSISIVISELLIRSCRMRMSAWYRGAFYAMLCVFFAAPPCLGYAVAHRYDTVAGAGSALFSIAFAATMLLLVPAVAIGRRSTRRNGTPWRWPWYPLAAFAVVVILAGIRTHAIWMSFGFQGNPVTFEPMLLLPMLASLIVLLCEAGIGLQRPVLVRNAALATPVMLLCGLSGGGMTNLPIQAEIESIAGSGWTSAILMVATLFVYMTIRRIPGAIFGVPAMILLTGFTAPLPEFAESMGLRPWMIVLVGTGTLYWMIMNLLPKDWLWASLAAIVATAIAMVGRNYGFDRQGYVAAIVFAWAAMMILGAVFRTDLAEFLRVMAATMIVVGCGAAAYRFFFFDERWQVMVLLVSGICDCVWLRMAGPSQWVDLCLGYTVDRDGGADRMQQFSIRRAGETQLADFVRDRMLLCRRRNHRVQDIDLRTCPRDPKTQCERQTETTGSGAVEFIKESVQLRDEFWRAPRPEGPKAVSLGRQPQERIKHGIEATKWRQQRFGLLSPLRG